MSTARALHLRVVNRKNTMTTKIMLALTLLLPSGACDLEDSLDFGRTASVETKHSKSPRAHEPPRMVLLRLAVEQGELDAEPEMQRVLEGLGEAHEAGRDRHQALGRALADAVGSGRVETGAFADHIAAIEVGARAEGQALSDALDLAHSRLDASERDAVLDDLPAPPEGPPGADGQPPHAGGGHGPGGLLLLAELELDEIQQQALREALGEPIAPDHPAPPDLESFADENFDATSLGLPTLQAAHELARVTRQIELLVALVPLLDEDQRTTLEQQLRESRGPARTMPG